MPPLWTIFWTHWVKDSIVVKRLFWLIGLAPPSPMFRLALIANFPWILLTLLSIFTVKFSFGFKGYTRNWTALLFNPCRHFMCRPTHNYSFIAYLLTCGLNQFSGLLVDYWDWSLDLLLRSFRSKFLGVFTLTGDIYYFSRHRKIAWESETTYMPYSQRYLEFSYK